MTRTYRNQALGIRLTITDKAVRIRSTRPRCCLFEQDPASRIWIQDTLERYRRATSPKAL